MIGKHLANTQKTICISKQSTVPHSCLIQLPLQSCLMYALGILLVFSRIVYLLGWDLLGSRSNLHFTNTTTLKRHCSVTYSHTLILPDVERKRNKASKTRSKVLPIIGLKEGRKEENFSFLKFTKFKYFKYPYGVTNL